MDKQQAFEHVGTALTQALGQKVEITKDTDLVEEDLIDSLDGMDFLLALEELTGVQFPEEGDLVEQGFYRIDFLLDYLSVHAA